MAFLGVRVPAKASVALLAALVLPAVGRAQDEPGAATRMAAAGRYQGANYCHQCHAQPIAVNQANGVLDWCLMTEFSTWRTVDKHSMAFAVLEGPRGREMGEKLGVDVTQPESGCLSCHAQNFDQQELTAGFSFQDGVNCEVCHGPSGNWAAPHVLATWRENTPEQKAELGMWDLRNPEVQSELCLSCHVGNAQLGRVVTHPMYAAGHPPLPSVDVARFVRNIPQHWRSKDDIPWWKQAPEPIRQANGIAEAKLYGVELTMVGNVIALRESMRLLADRADLDAASPDRLHRWPELYLNETVKDDPRFEDPGQLPSLAESRWPEMAMTHADCLSCHHDLRFPGWRQRRGYEHAPPGRPLPRSFPLALIDLNIERFGDESDRSEFDRRLDRLYDAFASRPFGRADEVRDAARELERWADTFHSRRLASAQFDKETATGLIRRLCEQNQSAIPDYDTARQIASAIQVIYWDLADQGADSSDGHDQILGILDHWDKVLNLGRYPKSEDRDALSLEIIRRLANDPDLAGFGAWTPLALGFPDDPDVYWNASRPDANELLDTIRGKLIPDNVRQKYVSPEFKEPLQEINNAGLKIALERASQYDPYRFQAELVQLGQLLMGLAAE
ncbi:multiheme c-type cytochrome [Tautonia sociabilis]|uniref:Cytochrome c-552/4 domain-containing protein n=1 Tax=Tautonia sociabilis TaxID=2080755 RepID=A0A432MME5_9BACT|nr:multiheme c-type cytochrome [Tautonia sociabilis]RUL88357.1 hypothetical protein TsocGM_07480 [Tautonia sociabilis]